MSEPQDDGTDVNITLPSAPRADEIPLEPDAGSPASPPPLPSPGGAKTPTERPPPALSPSRPPPAPRSQPLRPASRPPAQPRSPRRAAPPPQRAAPATQPARAAIRADTMPPRRRAPREAHRDSTPPPGPLTRTRDASKPPGRQRLMQMQAQLDEARSGLARQQKELNGLRDQIAARELKVEAMLGELREEGSAQEVQDRLQALDARGQAFAEDLRRRLERLPDRGAEVAAIAARVRDLEEGAELVRVRMRLERVDRELRDARERITALEGRERAVQSALAGHDAAERRIARLESLFAELAGELRETHDGRDLDELRARLAGVEALTVQTGSAVEAQNAQLEVLRESIIPPPIRATRKPVDPAEDLTRVKGIGTKYAKLLREVGVVTVAQIAAWSEDEIKRVATELGIKESRIRNAGWVDSARRLEGGG